MLFKLNVFVIGLFFGFECLAYINTGLWASSCQLGLKIEQIYGADNRVHSTEFFHQDANCQNESFRFETYGKVEYPNEPNHHIDFIYESIFLTVFKKNVVEDFNFRKVCGHNDWKLGSAQNITGLPCAIFNSDKNTQIPKTGDLKYGIYLIEGLSLYYGQLSTEFNGSTPEKRPVTLKRSTEYIFRNLF